MSVSVVYADLALQFYTSQMIIDPTRTVLCAVLDLASTAVHSDQLISDQPLYAR